MSGSTVVSLNTKMDKDDKELFVQTAERLGLSPSSAMRVFVRAFIEEGGFPFDVRCPYKLSSEAQASYNELNRKLEDGTVKGYQSHAELRRELGI